MLCPALVRSGSPAGNWPGLSSSWPGQPRTAVLDADRGIAPGRGFLDRLAMDPEPRGGLGQSCARLFSDGAGFPAGIGAPLLERPIWTRRSRLQYGAFEY